ncbi:DUF4292 domain-containing protein [Mucilaginibacter phyllosphaerae]|uniref:DUF4292 domain-containing protein n=1 Tax=Mucilaginibacter phyllosphaerae TaxID=1812349 RepID=A0A4Y8AA61_9SPHI|nr:DUF4292 domain-containing protein [Mucilaginibacter phyllosphaerae]MBB3969948.1 hypothetical protein [Mucilaginibacter phyllosphaerae]TEW65318.1 DUF4292 domain-containing protein [Mucilaginibacter phyllosphaerae]GGH16620.1 hypothetical protein GCM10007352_26160 [Mucilaginibacter phyllosphaerae]
MKRNTWNKIAIAFCLVALVACKSKKLVVVNRPTTPGVDSAALKENTMRARLEAIRAKQVTFNTFTGKAKTKLDINGNSNDVTLNIRMARDQKIWVSITAIIGIEVARAQITPDSIIVVNRLQNVYLKKPFSYVYTYASRQVTFKTLQALLLGNAIPEVVNNNNGDFTTQGNNIILSGKLQDLVYKLLLGPDMKVTQTNLANQFGGKSLQVANNIFIQADNRVIPSQIDISSAAGDKKIKLNLRYTQAEFDKPLEYPFSIPKSYEAAN